MTFKKKAKIAVPLSALTGTGKCTRHIIALLKSLTSFKQGTAHIKAANGSHRLIHVGLLNHSELWPKIHFICKYLFYFLITLTEKCSEQI